MDIESSIMNYDINYSQNCSPKNDQKLEDLPINTIQDKSENCASNIYSNILDIENKPDEVMISTMTITCALNTKYYLENICKYIDLNHTGIVTIRYGNPLDETTNRTLIPEKILNIQKRKKKKSFYNQATFEIKTKKSKIINLKLFSNGSIQMTGVKNVESIYEALNKLFYELKQKKFVIKMIDNKKTLIEKLFVSDISQIGIEHLQKFKIAMINSNYNIDFNIDREKLYELLIQDQYECTYDPNIHASVNIKYNHPVKPISIFVFEKGSIIITGARNCEQIKRAYEFFLFQFIK